MGSSWRRRLWGGGVALLAGWVPAAAVAAPRVRVAPRPSRQVNVTFTGALTVSWSSDPARGCAAAGLCGVSGSVEMLPNGSTGTSGGGPLPLEPQDQNAVARVQTQGADGAVVSTCADLVPIDFTLSIRHTPQGLRAVIPANGAFQSPSSGRCAGPTSSDLAALTLPARRFGAHSYDFSGTTTFSAGPFDVTAQSTLRALIGYGSSFGPGVPPGAFPGAGFSGSFFGAGSGGGPPAPTRPALQEFANVQYRVQSIQGALNASFSGLPAPLCGPLGACGDSGRLSETLTAGGMLSFVGARIVPRRVSASAALSDLRSGRLHLNGYLGLPALHQVVSETLAQADGTSCNASTSGSALSLQLAVRRRGDELRLASDGGFFGEDPMRTRCPGPSTADVLGGPSQSAATGPLALDQIGRTHLTLSLSGTGSFSGLSWSGNRGGTIVVTLTRVRERAGTDRVRLGAGQTGAALP